MAFLKGNEARDANAQAAPLSLSAVVVGRRSGLSFRLRGWIQASFLRFLFLRCLVGLVGAREHWQRSPQQCMNTEEQEKSVGRRARPRDGYTSVANGCGTGGLQIKGPVDFTSCCSENSPWCQLSVAVRSWRGPRPSQAAYNPTTLDLIDHRRCPRPLLRPLWVR